MAAAGTGSLCQTWPGISAPDALNGERSLQPLVPVDAPLNSSCSVGLEGRDEKHVFVGKAGTASVPSPQALAAPAPGLVGQGALCWREMAMARC